MVFTPLSGFVGGSMIGLSAAALLLLNGDILGASGILSTSFLTSASAQQWKLVFLASFLITVQLLLLQPNVLPLPPLESVSVVSPMGHLVGGFLVGVGTKLGNGCTSGHGICGLARLSKRSFVSVGTFMAVAMMTSVLVSHFGLEFAQTNVTPSYVPTFGYLVTLSVILRALYPLRRSNQDVPNQSAKFFGAALAGALFAMGLGVSQMISAAKVRDFLDVTKLQEGTYDPTLMTVMGGGVLVSALAYYVSGHPNLLCLGSQCMLVPTPIATKDQEGFSGVPKNTDIDAMLVTGATCFGLGWSIAGICPGPALFLAGAGSESVIHQWLPAFFMGSYLAKTLKESLVTTAAPPKKPLLRRWYFKNFTT